MLPDRKLINAKETFKEQLDTLFAFHNIVFEKDAADFMGVCHRREEQGKTLWVDNYTRWTIGKGEHEVNVIVTNLWDALNAIAFFESI